MVVHMARTRLFDRPWQFFLPHCKRIYRWQCRMLTFENRCSTWHIEMLCWKRGYDFGRNRHVLKACVIEKIREPDLQKPLLTTGLGYSLSCSCSWTSETCWGILQSQELGVLSFHSAKIQGKSTSFTTAGLTSMVPGLDVLLVVQIYWSCSPWNQHSP